MNIRKLKFLLESIQELEQARNPQTSSELLDELADHKDQEVQRAVASNPNTPFKTLISKYGQFPKEVSENPYITMEKEISMAGEPSVNINDVDSGTIVENFWPDEENKKYIDPGLLHMFSFHKDPSVKKFIARHPNTQVDTLEALLHDSGLDEYDKHLIARNPNATTKQLDKIAEKATNPTAVYHIANNPKTSKETLENLYQKNKENLNIIKKRKFHPDVELLNCFKPMALHPQASKEMFHTALDLNREDHDDRKIRAKYIKRSDADSDYLKHIALNSISPLSTNNNVTMKAISHPNLKKEHAQEIFDSIMRIKKRAIDINEPFEINNHVIKTLRNILK